MDWEFQLIHLYCFVCNAYQGQLCLHCQRMSNNFQPDFSDEEVLTIYLFGIIEQRRKISNVYQYASNHLRSFFPKLPCYGGYIQRLNRLSGVFASLVEQICQQFDDSNVLKEIHLLDSLPIVLAHAKTSQQAKIAGEIANKGRCASKNMWYYGVKIHLLGLRRPGTLPLPEYIGLTGAKDNDLTVFREIFPDLHGGKLFVDKAYADELLKMEALEKQNYEIWTPLKKKKGQKTLNASEQGLSTAVSRVRQPIESLFNWIEEKTGIQCASKVRSYNGILVHVFGRLAAAVWIIAFNS